MGVDSVTGPLVLAYRGTNLKIDAIRDYTSLLAAAIATAAPGLTVRTAIGAGPSGWQVTDARTGRVTSAPDFRDAMTDADWIMVQYNPFSWGHWGIAPWLPMRLAQLRRRSDARVALMCHEVYVPLHSARELVMGPPQRLQIAALAAVSDVVLASTGAGAKQIRRWSPRTNVVHLPVGSNLPDARYQRNEARGRLKLRDGQLALASFGTGHPSQLAGHVARAIDAIAAVCDVCVLNLGVGAAELKIAPKTRVVTPGALEGATLAALLAAADLCLLAYADGVSTRRTTMISALQQQLCVVATDGYNTDSLLREAGDAVRLTTPDSAEAFVNAAVELALDPADRAARARRGRMLFEHTFAWKEIARRALATLEYSK